jgi:hippurate hydrolase
METVMAFLGKACLGALGVMLLTGSALADPVASAWDVPGAKRQIDRLLEENYPQLDSLYKDLHSHPELAFQETQTAKRLASQMRALGFEVTEHIGKTGVLAVFKNGPGPTVLIRTELDALPMQEKTGLPYASQAKALWNGKETLVAHSCGHDIHMAAWVGTAKVLVEMKNQWHGTLMLVAQPAEESVSGARAMLDDGLYKRFGKPDVGFALHVAPGPVGEVYYKSGVITSNSDGLEITFKGRGGHGSMPSATIDPVLIASRFVVDVQSVVSREKDAAEFGVVTVGAIHAGSAGNIIPDQAQVSGTIRSYSAEVRTVLTQGVARTAKAVSDMSAAPAPDVAIIAGANAVVNDDALTQRTATVFKTAFGASVKALPAAIAASEDFSDFIIAGVPSVFFMIGGNDPAQLAELKAAGKPVPVNHSPFFAPVPEPSIKMGVRAMSLAVLNVMQ